MAHDPQVQKVADELAIRNLISRLAHLADMAGADDLDEYVGLFTEDASWSMPGVSHQGRASIREGARQRRADGRQGPGSNSRHIITTVAVAVDGSDTAAADSYLLFCVDTASSPTVQLICHYHDSFERGADGWRLAKRQIALG
jgi:3-phenylpropionate/cinnamic acid dioxygenase small subunit